MAQRRRRDRAGIEAAAIFFGNPEKAAKPAT